ncbi:MAG: DNA repair protein RecN [Clostridia bacterium]|nr:DNA repair protein RecN [Clostridia bacterium]
MLQKLCIKNVALIESVEINFTQGLNVLSGETGAGKSVIIESLNFVLGAKADKTIIRSGSDECFVRAEFDVQENNSIIALYNEFDFEVEDVLIITRKFTIDGKNSIKINGNTATVGMLKKFTSILVDVHGQSEHFNLLKNSNQLDLLDKLGGELVQALKTTIKSEYEQYKQTIKELNDLGGDESTRLVRLDILNYQINEIEKADLKENEEEELLSSKQKIQFQEKIANALNAVKSSIDDEGGVSDILSNASRMLSGISNLDDEYLKLYDRLESVFSELDDISNSATNFLDGLDVLELNPYEVEARLDLIKGLKAKYGNSILEINDFCLRAIEERNKLENCNEIVDRLSEIKLSKENALYALYKKLSVLRKATADEFKNNVIGELVELGMPKATFDVSFSELPEIEECSFSSFNGIDKIEFLFSANLGEPLKPLSLVISGGEMSRFMLAIKTQTSKHNDISTFIFDEIDAGISGNVAKIVAQKFAKIACDTQIIAISHLPQISAMADYNLFIQKFETGAKTITTVKMLNATEKIEEVVRLIGGGSDSESAINHATELIQKAKQFKNSLI